MKIIYTIVNGIINIFMVYQLEEDVPRLSRIYTYISLKPNHLFCLIHAFIDVDDIIIGYKDNQDIVLNFYLGNISLKETMTRSDGYLIFLDIAVRVDSE